MQLPAEALTQAPLLGPSVAEPDAQVVATPVTQPLFQ